MKRSRSPLTRGLALASTAVAFSLAVCAQAQTFTMLASFNGTEGREPAFQSLVQGTDGNFYGTAHWGGAFDGGTVFEVTPAGKISDVYSFCPQSGCADGNEPNSGLVLASNGDFYGTTEYGGANSQGTIFKVTRAGQLTTLYSLCSQPNCVDGQYPQAALIQASNKNLYGTATNGGAYGGGVVFEITLDGTYRSLYSFCALTNCADGERPYGGVIQGNNGNLYGTTSWGGAYGGGTVFEITRAGKLKTLYSFCAQAYCTDGQDAFAGLVQAANGNIYGTTNLGGNDAKGTVFEVTPAGQFTRLYSFDGGNSAAYPWSALIQANDGNLYSNTEGTIYEISPSGAYTSLYTFCLGGTCAASPEGALLQGTDGTFYGTTCCGGIDGDGTVYSYSLGLPALARTVPIAGKVGARVIILGNGLTGSTSVTFNGTPATFTVESDTYIAATVPTGATSGTVSVVTPTGTLNSNPAFRVTKIATHIRVAQRWMAQGFAVAGVNRRLHKPAPFFRLFAGNDPTGLTNTASESLGGEGCKILHLVDSGCRGYNPSSLLTEAIILPPGPSVCQDNSRSTQEVPGWSLSCRDKNLFASLFGRCRCVSRWRR